MYFDRFDICEAYYLYARDYSAGAFSPEYRIIQALERMRFLPVEGLQARDMSPNGRAILRALVSGETPVRDRWGQ